MRMLGNRLVRQVFGIGFACLAGVCAALPLRAGTIDPAAYEQKTGIVFRGYDETLADFPAMVKVGPRTISGFRYDQCSSADGSEVRFALLDGTLLDHELEQWNAATDGESIFWVRLPELAKGTSILVYWGLKGGYTAPTVSSAAVWPGYVGVWHLGEASGTCANSTAKGSVLDAVPYGAQAAEDSVAVAGIAGQARQAAAPTESGTYDARHSCLKVTGSDALKTEGTHAVSGWFRATQSHGASGPARLISWKEKQSASTVGWEIALKEGSDEHGVKAFGQFQNQMDAVDPSVNFLSGWVHLFVSYFTDDGARRCSVYLNGKHVVTSSSGGLTASDNAAQPLLFGGMNAGSPPVHDFAGAMDEIRILDFDNVSTGPSATWVQAEYDNLTDDGFADYMPCGANSQPEIASLDLSFIDGTTQPKASVTLGCNDPQGTYRAAVVLEIGYAEGVWRDRADFLSGNGQTLELTGRLSPAAGTQVYVRATVTCNGRETRTATTNAPATGQSSPYLGHGGGPDVIHVRSGATGDGSGSDWFNALPSIAPALDLLSSDRSEIWICGDLPPLVREIALIKYYPVALRGGFTGIEDSLDERTKDGRSTIDGGNAVDCIQNYDKSGKKPTGSLTLDGLRIVRASTHGVFKMDSTGDLVISNCDFVSCAAAADTMPGKGMFIQRAGSARLTVVGCTFADLVETKAPASDRGYAVSLFDLVSATFENCLFVTNGVRFAGDIGQCYTGAPVGSGCFPPARGNGAGCQAGAAIYASNTPLTLDGCRFAANRCSSASDGASACPNSLGSGGIVRLRGNCGGSVIRNTAFVGNFNHHVWAYDKNPGIGWRDERAGALVVDLASSAQSVSVENCTFAYNICEGNRSPAGINVLGGSLLVKNSIFHSNTNGAVNEAGCDIEVKTGASARMDYCLFDATNGVHVSSESGATVTFGVGNVCGDPRLVTTDVLESCLDGSMGTLAFGKTTASVVADINCHVRSRSPAIDSGDPASAFKREPRPNGRRVNLGAYGNTPWATKSPGGLIFYLK